MILSDGWRAFSGALVLFLVLSTARTHAADQLEPIKYNNPGLVVDLGVGL